ncbi:MAG TPA: phosphatidate cytidylyltransferase [Miltoncostaeaceae bacterium]|nr:phosphatidate cytidylyltransferase [Miltoncostaeaceae bacterium]
MRRLRETTGRIRRRGDGDGRDGAGAPPPWPDDDQEDALLEDDPTADDDLPGDDDDADDPPPVRRLRAPRVPRDLVSRLVVAVPGIAVAVAVVAWGGAAFAAALCLLVVLALYEFYSLTAAARPLRWAGYVGALLPVVLAFTMTSPERGVLLGLAIGAGLVAVAGLVIAGGEDLVGRMAVTALGMVYVGLPFGMLMATRELPVGAAAVANVLVGTWVFDTASYAGGRMWGRRRVAPRVSPGKTWEGLVCGLVVGTLSVGVAGLYMDWISGRESLLLGAAICVAAFVGDLFESLIKRDVGAKDSGRLLLGHGGVLDRFDALMFATVTAYFVTIALVY